MLHINPKYQLIGHRGVAGLAPENTIASFMAAAKLGLDWIEFDVQLTCDTQWVVIHDDTIDRTTPESGNVRDFSLAKLTSLPAGLWFDPPDPEAKIPSLLTTLETAKHLNLNCNIEIKNAELNPKLHAKLMSEFINRYPDLCNRQLYTSFSLECLIELRRLQPELAIGFLLDSLQADSIAIAKSYNFSTIHLDVAKINLADVASLDKAGIPLLLYTVNDKATYEYWLKQNITAVFTDRPDLVL